MKADRIRATISVDPETKVVALIIAMLRPYGYATQVRLLRAVCGALGLLTTENKVG